MKPRRGFPARVGRAVLAELDPRTLKDIGLERVRAFTARLGGLL